MALPSPCSLSRIPAPSLLIALRPPFLPPSPPLPRSPSLPPLPQAKVRRLEARIDLRLSRPSRLAEPRLEQLTKQLGLDSFEKNVLLVACGNAVSPLVKQAAPPPPLQQLSSCAS